MSRSMHKLKTDDANEDPLTGAAGAHPVGVALGATGGAAAGAAVGAVGGPVGAVVGAAVGGLAGGLAGKGAAETVNPTAEDAYWSQHYHERPYVQEGREYAYYKPAYRFGWESYSQYAERTFDEIDENLAREWDQRRLEPRLGTAGGRLRRRSDRMVRRAEALVRTDRRDEPVRSRDEDALELPVEDDDVVERCWGYEMPVRHRAQPPQKRRAS
jgi:hypothetical protein